MTVMAGATIAPSLPQIERVFAGTANVELLTRLVLTITAIFTVIGSPIAGMIVDRFGRKPLLIVGLIFYAVAGTTGLYVDSLLALLVGRALLGLSVACIMTTATTLIVDLHEPAERATAIGRQSAFVGAGGVVFLLVGGFLADIGWRAPFGIYFASLLILFFALRLVQEPDRKQTHEGDKTAAWPIPTVVMIVAFVLIAQIAFYLWPVQLPFYIEERFGLGGSSAGLAIAMASGTTVVTSMLYGRFRKVLGNLGLVAFAYGGLGVVNLLVAYAPNFPFLLAALVLGGASIGLMFPHGANWITSVVPEPLRGRAVGLATAALFSGHFLSPLISQPVMQAVGYAQGYQLFGQILVGMGVVIGAIAAGSGRLRRRVG